MVQNTWKTKLAILWIMQEINFLAALLILFLETGGFLKGGEPGDESGAYTAISIAIVSLVIFIMTCLSFLAKPKLSRWPNIILGLIMLNYKVVAMFGVFGDPSPAFIINEIWGGIAAVLIIWYGWKIPNHAKDIA